MLKLLSNLKTELTATIKDIEVRELNLNSLEESLNSIFKNIKPSVTIIPGTGSGGEEGEGDSSGDNDSSGSLEGEGAHNITGGTINGVPSVEGEVAQEVVNSANNVVINKLSSNSENAQDAMETSNGSTVVYNKETKETTLYSWFEVENKREEKGILLYNYGLTNGQIPLIHCISYTSDGDKKTIKAYTSKRLYDAVSLSSSNWNDKITDTKETVTSPITGETYYIVAEDSVNVGETYIGCVYWSMGVCINTADRWEDNYVWLVENFGFGIDHIPDDFFDSENITEEDIAKQEPKEDEIKIDNIKTENGNLFTEEEIIEIEQAIKEEVKQAVEQAKQENKTEEEIEQIKQTIIEEKTSEYTTQSFKEDFKEQLLSQYKKENSLILFVNNKSDKLSETMKEISQKIEAINSGEITAEDIEKETEGKAQKILDSLGIDENTTEDEYREIAEKKANELIDAINGKKTDDEVVNAILDNMNESNSDNNGGFNFGLRRDIYERIKAISDFGKDIDCYLYSIGVAEVTARYFTTGVMHIAVHIGGLCIVGVGTSLVLSAIQNLINGMQLIQSGTKSTNPIDQAQKLADGISAMYSNGTITSLVIGTMTAAPSPIPFVGSGMQTSIQHSSMKIIIMISALAAYIMLMAGGLASMAAGTQKAWNQMLSAIGAKDGNDLFAMLMAAGIKVSLITTIAKTYETTAQSTGTGLLVPFGP